jgi:hypothetical protein
MDERKRIARNLQAGAAALACGGYLKSLDGIHRSEIFVDAGYDRLVRKYLKIREIYLASGENWNQTFYAMMFRAMDVTGNRSAYERLAKIVDYGMILREQQSAKSVEALLIGTSGLLANYRDDEYILSLKGEFYYLAKKYDILPMRAGEWRLAGIRPYNHPVLRLAQIASFLTQKDFVMNALLDCRTPADVERLFGVEASPYWSSHFIPAELSADIPKRIGREKSNLLGINLVAPLQYAYGSYIDNERLRERAISLLEAIPAENNQYMRRWAGYGIKAHNAFESQALLQIATEYCKPERCGECPIGMRIIEKAVAEREGQIL